MRKRLHFELGLAFLLASAFAFYGCGFQKGTPGQQINTPSGLAATAATSQQIDLSWSDNSEGETGYLIQMRTEDGEFADASRVGEGSTYYSEYGLTPETTYEFRVKALGSEEDSDFSEIASATTNDIEIQTGQHHLGWYAKVTSNENPPATNWEWGPYNAINWEIGHSSYSMETLKGRIWNPVHTNSSSLTFEWNSQVEIDEIRIYDNPIENQQITNGSIRYSNDTPGTSYNFSTQDFGPLPDVVNSPSDYLSIAGPSDPVTSFRLNILDHIGGDDAGIAEVLILGRRVDEDIPLGEIMYHMHVSGCSSVYDPLWNSVEDPPDGGEYRTANIKDGSLATQWATAGNGSNAYIELDFDRPYDIHNITLSDRPSGSHNFTGATVIFLDTGDEEMVTKGAATPSVLVEPSSPIQTSRIRINLVGTPGENTGLSGVSIEGSYTAP